MEPLARPKVRSPRGRAQGEGSAGGRGWPWERPCCPLHVCRPLGPGVFPAPGPVPEGLGLVLPPFLPLTHGPWKGLLGSAYSQGLRPPHAAAQALPEEGVGKGPGTPWASVTTTPVRPGSPAWHGPPEVRDASRPEASVTPRPPRGPPCMVCRGSAGLRLLPPCCRGLAVGLPSRQTPGGLQQPSRHRRSH